MSNVRKTLQMTSLLFGMVVLFCYIGWHLGYDGLIIAGEIVLPEPVIYTICKILVFINLTIVGSFVMNEYTRKIIFYTVPLVILTGVFDSLNLETIGSGPLQVVYFLILVLITKKTTFKGALLRTLIMNVIIIGYQMVAIIFKTGQLTFNYALPFYTGLMFSIDMIILLLLVWSIGGVKNERKLERLVFPGRVFDEKTRDESHQRDSESSLDVPVGAFEQWVMRSVIGAVQILQWGFILWICSLDNMFLDAFVMTTSFICHGMVISKRKHLKPIILCTLAATAMFYFAARFTISFRYSQFFPILVGLILVYTMYRISYEFEKAEQEKLKKELERIKKLESQLDEAWKQIDRLS